MVVSAYRRDDFADADSWTAQAAMVLEKYSNAAISEATDPVRGIQSHVKFPPSLAELREYCDELNRRSNYPKQWEEQSRKQLAERAQIEQQKHQETPEYRAQVIDRARNEMRAAGFRFSEDRKQLLPETASTVKAKLKISDEDWDKLPNLPSKWAKL